MNEDERDGPEARGPGALASTVEQLAAQRPDAIGRHVREIDLPGLMELAVWLSPRARSELVLHAPRPMALLRALPSAEVYLMIRELGPHDALPLLSLASASQLVHLLDLESWRGDRFDPDRAGAWIAVLLEAGESTLRRLLRAIDDETLTLLLRGWMRLEPLTGEDDEPRGTEPDEEGVDGAMAPDGQYEIRPARAEHLQAASRMAEMLFLEQPARWRAATWGITAQLPSELEEEALHWRQSRLEEHGYPSLDEALTIYAAPAAAGVIRAPLRPVDAGAWPVSREPLQVEGPDGWLATALAGLPQAERSSVLHQFVAIANRVLVADGADTGDPESHRAAMDRAVGCVRVALEARAALDPFVAARTLESVALLDLFREGHARVIVGQREAQRLVREGWPRLHEGWGELLDPVLGGRLGGLLEPRPLHAEVRADGRIHRRPFRRLAEIEEARAAVELSGVLGTVFVDRLGLDLSRVLQPRPTASATEPPQFDRFFRTLFAWHAVSGEIRCDPLPTALVRRFLEDRPGEGPALDLFVAALGDRLDLSARERALLSAFGRACSRALDSAGGGADPRSLFVLDAS